MRIICKISSLFCDFYEHWGGGRVEEEIVRINIMIQHMGQAYVLAVRQITTHPRYLFLALRLIKSHRVRLVSFMFSSYRVRSHARDSRTINYIINIQSKIIIRLIVWRISLFFRIECEGFLCDR